MCWTKARVIFCSDLNINITRVPWFQAKILFNRFTYFLFGFKGGNIVSILSSSFLKGKWLRAKLMEFLVKKNIRFHIVVLYVGFCFKSDFYFKQHFNELPEMRPGLGVVPEFKSSFGRVFHMYFHNLQNRSWLIPWPFCYQSILFSTITCHLVQAIFFSALFNHEDKYSKLHSGI